MQDLQSLKTLGADLTQFCKSYEDLENRHKQLTQWACIMCFQLQFNLSTSEIRNYSKFIVDAHEKGWVAYSFSGFSYEVVFIENRTEIKSPEDFMEKYNQKKG